MIVPPPARVCVCVGGGGGGGGDVYLTPGIYTHASMGDI